MARTINLSISDRLEALIKAQAQSRGLKTLDECVMAILNEALAGSRLPQVPPDAHQLVLELRKGLEGEGRTPTREEWDRKKDSLGDPPRRSKAG